MIIVVACTTILTANTLLPGAFANIALHHLPRALYKGSYQTRILNNDNIQD